MDHILNNISDIMIILKLKRFNQLLNVGNITEN